MRNGTRTRDWRYYRPNFIAEVIFYSEPGPILDVGTGTGLFVEAALRWGLYCVGIEGSGDAVEIGRQRYPNLSLQRAPSFVKPGSVRR